MSDRGEFRCLCGYLVNVPIFTRQASLSACDHCGLVWEHRLQPTQESVERLVQQRCKIQSPTHQPVET